MGNPETLVTLGTKNTGRRQTETENQNKTENTTQQNTKN